MVEEAHIAELDLEEVEEEGNQIGSKNYRFSKIGEPVPILKLDSEFDPHSPPSRPLAVSQRFGVLFVAHSTGFCVARTKDVIKSAEDIKNGATGSSIGELCVVDVPLGKVSILALSANSSTLAASVGSHLHFFSVTALLTKEQKPSSFSLDVSSCIKDLRWSTKLDNHYLVLSSNGKLCHGAYQDDVKDVMDEVDAFDWSIEGKFIAVARKNVLCIMSSKIKEKLRIRLSFTSMFGDSDANCVIKVDSIRWVRPDSIILGCYQLTDDGTEENYLVQVISCKSGKITDASSSLVVLSFSDVFPCLTDPAMPFGSGPHMCLSYLDTRGLALTANRKNMDQHIVLFGWAIEDKNEVAVIEIVNDSWLPRIDSQGNGDDNLILGLSVDEVSYDEKVKLICGEEDKEVSPCCIVLCVTIDGKLSMFHFASAAGSSVPPDVAYSVSDEEEHNHPVGSSGYGMPMLSTSEVGRSIDGTQFGLNSDELEAKLNRKGGKETPINRIETVKAAASSELFRGSAPQKAPLEMLDHDRDVRQQPVLEKLGGNTQQIKASQPVDSRAVTDFIRSKTQEHAEVRPVSGSFSGQLSTDNKSLHRSSEARISSKPSDGRASSLLNAGLLGNRSVASLTTANSEGQFHSSYVNKTGGPSTPADQLAMRGSVSAAGMTNSLPNVQSTRPQLHENNTMRKSSDFKSQSDMSNQRMHIPTGLRNSEPNLSKQIRSVEEMAKELDVLLECIEGPGGFNDASITLQKVSVASLEEGIWALSDRCRTWMEIIDQRLDEIQLLPDKMVQGSFRVTMKQDMIIVD